MPSNLRFFRFDLSQNPVDSLIYVKANTLQIELEAPGPLTRLGFIQVDNNPPIPVFDATDLNLGFVQDIERVHLRFYQEAAPGYSLVLTASTAAKLVVG
ncbi:MAG: hypothetical protein NUW37_17985 [Planctomycetes bacterium]|nr:hypothetical protein [Planctomycetota bacterium]MCR4318237.1 hypothetical protein [Planctomycetota bacterium]